MKLVSRTKWGARKATPPTNITPQYGGIAIHYIGGKGKITPKSHLKCASIVRGIQQYHMSNNGWADIAYSFLVCQHGYVFEGRGIGRRTAANGTTSGNQNFYAVCGLVNDADSPTDSMKNGIKDACVYLRQRGNAGKRIVGHKNLITTSCPGPIYKWILDGSFQGKKGSPGNRYPGILKVGSKGPSVKKLQQQLILKKYSLPKYGADGDFGNETQSAVKSFQRDAKILVDGIVGRRTWGKLF